MSQERLRAIGYLRVSTDEQAANGSGLAAQRDAIQRTGQIRGWDVRWILDEGFTAGSLARPGITEGLQLLAAGEADVLVASKLDRLSRSVLDFAMLLDKSQEQGWGLVLLDFDLDTTSPAGRLVAHMMSAVAEFERQRISERTREALAAVRARGQRLGRPRVLSSKVRGRIVREREAGLSLAEIADGLNREGVPTAHGGKQWYHSTVGAALRPAAHGSH